MSETKNFNRFEAAKRLGVAVITIDRALANKEIRHFRVGRRVLFSDAHLQEFLTQREQPPQEGRRRVS